MSYSPWGHRESDMTEQLAFFKLGSSHLENCLIIARSLEQLLTFLSLCLLNYNTGIIITPIYRVVLKVK